MGLDPGERLMRRRPKTRLGRAFSVASWPPAIALLALGAAWLFSGSAWQLDLIANLNAQWLLIAAAAGSLWLFTRRWTHAALAAIACLSLLVSLSIGRASLLAPAVAIDTPPSADVVRFFHYNASTRGEGETIEALMDSAHADVFSILCPPVRYQRDVIYGNRLADRFAGKLVRQWRQDADGFNTDITAAFVVSRWPMRAVDTTWAGSASDYLIAAIVDRPAPAGPFAVIAVHPRSPRSPERWHRGNAVVETVAHVANRLQADGLPVVVLADLNSTPSGLRSRTLWSLANLRRAKPLLSLATTYPLPLSPGDDAPYRPQGPDWGPFGIAIDDTIVSPTIGVASWSALPKRESGHSPILVDLSIPPASPSVTPASGR
jgi:endonuclease/exonuclease/phosphatase family metal-dependent hydrolase